MKHLNYYFRMFLPLLAMSLMIGCSDNGGDDEDEPVPDYSFDAELTPPAVTRIEVGASAEVEFAISGPGITDLELDVEATNGWGAEITSEIQSLTDYTGTITVQAPDKAGNTIVTLYAAHKEGEIKSKYISLEAYEPEKPVDPTDPDDPHSTKDNLVIITQTGWSPVAIGVETMPAANVDRYYFDVMAASKVQEYSERIGEEWGELWRDSIYDRLNATWNAPWSTGEDVYRFTEYVHNNEERLFAEDTYYYVYTVVVFGDGTLGPLELTRVKTLPKDNSDFNPTPATRVEVKYETTYDIIEVELTSKPGVNGYYFNLVEQANIDSYIETYGKKWDVGFLDKWKFYLKYENSDILSFGTDGYAWSNRAPSTTYFLFVVYFDEAGELFLELTPITTDIKDPVRGTPRVAIEETARTASTVTLRLTPNSDCGKYTIDIWSEPDLAEWQNKYGHKYYQELINFANKYGRVTNGSQTVTLDINDYYPKSSELPPRTWDENKYDLVILPFDKYGVYDETGVTYTHIGHTGSKVPAYSGRYSGSSGPRLNLEDIEQNTPKLNRKY